MSKWGLTVDRTGMPNITILAAGSKTGEVINAPIQHDAQFLAPISVGGQTIMMDFDTGSSDLWLFSTALPAAQSEGRTLYDPAKSQTFQQMVGSSFAVTFGDSSSVSGNIVGTDVVDIGGVSVTQAVELATQVSASFIENTQSNGLVGLAFSSINTVVPQGVKTFLDSIQNQLALPVLTANLKHNTAGSYSFGRIDKTEFTGNLAFTPVDNSNGFWQFESNSFAVGNGAVQANQEQNPAIADTGTSLLLLDPSVVNAYWSEVEGAAFDSDENAITFPCNAVLPDLHVALGANNMGTIPGSLLNYFQLSNSRCFGALQSSGSSAVQIMGDIMFKAQFVVFNIGDNTLGFAPHA